MSSVLDLVIFDCDGVLIDSEIIGITLTLKLLKEHGVHIDFNEFSSRFSGLTWDELIESIRTQKGVALPASIRDSFHAALLEAFATSLKRIDGTLEVLSALDIPYCICSNSSASQLDYSLSLVELKHFFPERIFSAVDLGPGRGKPQPDIFLHAAKILHADPVHTLVVEDSVHGVTAASRAGMTVIGFTGGAHTYPQHAEKLLAAGARSTIASMHQLPDEIARLAGQGDTRS